MRLLEDSLAEEVLSEKIKAGDTAVVDVGEDNKVKVLLGEKFDFVTRILILYIEITSLKKKTHYKKIIFFLALILKKFKLQLEV